MDLGPFELISFRLSELVDIFRLTCWDQVRQWAEVILLLAVVVLALFQEPIKNKWRKAKLRIKIGTDEDFAQYSDGRHAVYYHLNIENLKRMRPATHVRVLLCDIYKLNERGAFEKLPQPFPFQFLWSPAKFHGNDPFPTIIKSRTADFGYLEEDQHTFAIAIDWKPYNFNGDIHLDNPKDEPAIYRYGITLESDTFTPKNPFYIEVSWDGRWSPDKDKLKQHLRVAEIKNRDWLPG